MRAGQGKVTSEKGYIAVAKTRQCVPKEASPPFKAGGLGGGSPLVRPKDPNRRLRVVAGNLRRSSET